MYRIYQIFALVVLSTATAHAHPYHSGQNSHVAENYSEDESTDTNDSRYNDSRSQDEGKAESYPLPEMHLRQNSSYSQQNVRTGQAYDDSNQSQDTYQQSRNYNQDSSYSQKNVRTGQAYDDSNQSQDTYQQSRNYNQDSSYNQQNVRTGQTYDGSNQSQQPSKANMTVLEIIKSNPHFSKFAQALQASGVAEELVGETELTIFVPSDQAFQRVPPRLLNPENRELLAKLIKHHIIDDIYNRADLKTDKVEALDGKDLNIEVNGHRIRVNNAEVTQADIKASNGVIHVIDAVLLTDNQKQTQNRNQNRAQSKD